MTILLSLNMSLGIMRPMADLPSLGVKGSERGYGGGGSGGSSGGGVCRQRSVSFEVPKLLAWANRLNSIVIYRCALTLVIHHPNPIEIGLKRWIDVLYTHKHTRTHTCGNEI